jgi:DNA-binding GntR family transcriptional regulator
MAASNIRKLIFNGDLRPGQRVPQDEIAVALGVSRIPLREALIALEREGWVTIEIHRGTYVNALDIESIEDHFEVIGLVYARAMHWALERGGRQFVEQFATLESRLAGSTDRAEAGELLSSMYRAIIDGASSARLRVVLRAISTLVPEDFFATLPSVVDIERRSVAAMVRALRHGDADRASAEFPPMMRRVAKEVAGIFRARGLIGESVAGTHGD